MTTFFKSYGDSNFANSRHRILLEANNSGMFDYVRVYQGNVLSTADIVISPEIKLFPNPVTDELTIINSENTKMGYSLSLQLLISLNKLL